MSSIWRSMDEEINLQPMPSEFQKYHLLALLAYLF